MAKPRCVAFKEFVLKHVVVLFFRELAHVVDRDELEALPNPESRNLPFVAFP